MDDVNIFRFHARRTNELNDKTEAIEIDRERNYTIDCDGCNVQIGLNRYIINLNPYTNYVLLSVFSFCFNSFFSLTSTLHNNEYSNFRSNQLFLLLFLFSYGILFSEKERLEKQPIDMPCYTERKNTNKYLFLKCLIEGTEHCVTITNILIWYFAQFAY